MYLIALYLYNKTVIKTVIKCYYFIARLARVVFSVNFSIAQFMNKGIYKKYKSFIDNKRCYLPFDLFLGALELLVRPEEDIPLSLIESWADEALPVASLSRIMLSYPLLPPLW